MTDHAAPSILSGQDGFYPKTQIKKVAVWIKTCLFIRFIVNNISYLIDNYMFGALDPDVIRTQSGPRFRF
jgi:hypothetical protein